MLAFRDLSECNLYTRHAGAIGIVFGVFAELRVDGVFLDRNLEGAHLGGKVAEVLVDVLDNSIRVLARQQEVKKFTGNGQNAGVFFKKNELNLR